jgi:hypothetical protein
MKMNQDDMDSHRQQGQNGPSTREARVRCDLRKSGTDGVTPNKNYGGYSVCSQNSPPHRVRHPPDLCQDVEPRTNPI